MTRIALALAAGALACTSPASDSRVANVATWQLEMATTTIGHDEEPEALLQRVTGATRLSDGSVIVADLGEAPLRRYNADGSLAARIARSGAGPGEMKYLAFLFRCGHQFITYDIDGYRISVFSLDGKYQREFRFSVPAGQQVPYISACNADGRFAHLGWGPGVPTAGAHRDTVPVWMTASPDGEFTVFDSVPASERWGQTRNGRPVGSMPMPFGRQPVIGMGRTRIYIGSGDTFMVRVYNLDGVLVDSIAIATALHPVTNADVQDHIEQRVLEEGETRRTAIENRYAEIVYPKSHAAYTALLVDAEDHVWVREFTPLTSTMSTWHVFAPDGQRVATVALPRDFEVYEIGRDYLLGKQIDESEGKPLVRVYGLKRLDGGGVATPVTVPDGQ